MNKKQNIDQLFQDKLRDVEVTPRDTVWKAIDADLKAKNKNPFYNLKLTKYVAAAILLMISGVLGLENLDSVSNKKGNSVTALQVANKLENQKVYRSTNLQKRTILEKSANQTNTINGIPERPVSKTDLKESLYEKKAVVSSRSNKELTTFSNESKSSEDNVATNSIRQYRKINFNTSSHKYASKSRNNNKNIASKATIKLKSANEIATVAAQIMQNESTDTSKTSISSEIQQRTLKWAGNSKQQTKHSTQDDRNKSSETFESIAKSKEHMDEISPSANQTIGLDVFNKGNVHRNLAELKTDSLLFKKNLDSTKTILVEVNKLERLLNEKELKKREQKINRWQITSNVAPIYFSSMTNGSPLDTKFADNQKVFYINQSFGIGVRYGLTSKIKIRAGLNKISINYDTKGVAYSMNSTGAKLANLSLNSVGTSIAIGSIKNVTVFGKSQGNSLADFDMGAIGSLTQKMGYFELPIEISYKIGVKKFSIDLITGLSTFYLQQNSVFLQTANAVIEIGTASNLNQFHFSGNIGLGMNYKILKNVEASIEPTFKYQVNTFSRDSGNFRPYIFGLYSGLKYNF